MCVKVTRIRGIQLVLTALHWFSSIKQGFSVFSNHGKFDLKVNEGFVWLARISHIFAFETSVWAVFDISYQFHENTFLKYSLFTRTLETETYFLMFGFCVKQIRSFGGGNAFYIYVICFYTKILCSLVFFPFLIIVISVNTFSFDTLGDLWCMYGIFIHLVMTRLATAHYNPPVLIT